MIKGKLEWNLMCKNGIVVIKWNKQTFNDFEMDPTLGVEVLKAQLFDVSNVPVDKQKILFKGKILKVSFLNVWLIL